MKYDPNSAVLKKGLEDVEGAMKGASTSGFGAEGNPFANMFGPDVFAKIAANPKLSSMLADAEVVAKIKAVQSNPALINSYMSDPKMMQLVIGLLGLDAKVATSEEMEAMEKDGAHVVEPEEFMKKDTPSPQKEEEKSEPELTDAEKDQKRKREASDAEKLLGNNFYKKRQFEEALEHYDKAWDLDATNIAVLTNKSAALYEKGDFKVCIEVCEKAIEVGREMFADFKLMARAYGRMGNAFAKLDDLENAIKYLNKSLAEHRTADVLTKLRELEKLKKQNDEEAYRDPKLSDEARERGNELFKAGNYSAAVKEYTEAIKRNDKEPKNFSNRAACYMKLMAFPEADKDCDTAINLDPNFVKAYIRKAAILFAKRDFMKCVDLCNEAKEKDTEGKHTAEIDAQVMKAYAGLNENQHADREDVAKKAMNDPEVREIMGDPVMQQILQQMQTDPAAAQDHMKNPAVAAKIKTLINAGILRIG